MVFSTIVLFKNEEDKNTFDSALEEFKKTLFEEEVIISEDDYIPGE